MLSVTAEEMIWPPEKIAGMARDRTYPGFSGESCSSCKAKANVLARQAGWFCPCGAFNCQSWSHTQFPHEGPTYGPTPDEIREGLQAGGWDEYIRSIFPSEFGAS